jgi:hypothetical protein
VPHFTARSDARYRQRLLGATAAVLTLLLALVRGWPVPGERSSRPFHDRAAERIALQGIQPTSQPEEKHPPPPAPRPPVVVPNDQVVTDPPVFGESALQVETPGPDAERQDGTDQATAAPRAPDRGARLLRNVQPRDPEAAREDGGRARIELDVAVSKQGRVTNVWVRNRWRIAQDGSAEPVARLDSTLEAAARRAARQSLFRPAQSRGEPIATRTTLTFTFGP